MQRATLGKSDSEAARGGGEGRGEQRRGLHMKALMRDLGTRLACRHHSFCKKRKTLWK